MSLRPVCGWLQSFVQPEKLDSAEAWYCPKCKEHVQVSMCTSCFQMIPDSVTPLALPSILLMWPCMILLLTQICEAPTLCEVQRVRIHICMCRPARSWICGARPRCSSCT